MTEKKRNLQIDGLKAAAVLLVVLFHFFGRYDEIYHVGTDLPVPLMRKLGEFGVTVFFVVSGYFMALDRGGLRFALKKILRLWPVYMLGISACFLLTRHFPLPGRTVTLNDYILNIPFINGFINKPYVDGAHWYITDLIGCILIYSLVNLTRDIKARAAAIVFFTALSAALGYCAGHYEGYKIISILYKLVGSGHFAAVLSGEVVCRIVKKQYIPAALMWALAMALCLLCFPKIEAVKILVSQLLLWIAAMGYVKPLGFKPICKIGEASYSIFILHQNIGFLIIYYASQAMGKYSLWLSAAVTVIMLSVGLTVFVLIEKPIGLLINKIINKAAAH